MKCWEIDCEAERYKNSPCCKDHLKKKRIEEFKKIGTGTAGILFGIAIFIGVIAIIIGGIVESINEPNINIKTLDNLCKEKFGENSVFLKEENYNLICATPNI